MRNSHSQTVQFESGHILECYSLVVDVFLFPYVDVVKTIKKVKISRKLAVQRSYARKEKIQVNDSHVNTFTPNDVYISNEKLNSATEIFH